MSNLVFDESSANREASHGYAWWFSGDTFEKAAAEERTRRKRSFIHHLTSHPGRLTIIYFLLLVALSTSLLLLPVSSHEEEPTSFSTAFFTAVSALSTCGISIVNATTHWTAFGQVALLVSVQMGGLGVMTFASLIALAANHHMKATQRLLTANELGTTKLNEIRGVLTVVITTTFIIESVTFLALFPGLYGINRGNVRHTAREALFFAVMSYNNAGFTPDGAGLHVNNWAVGMPIMASAFCGTLGFPVLLNLMRCARHRTPPRRWSLHTKITLVTTFSLVLLSLAWFLLVEWDNPFLFKGADVETRLRYGVVAAVMPRSSGFDLSWVPQVSEPTKVFMSVIMFIGGGSTSTAGGIRGEHHRRLPVPSAERFAGVDARLGLLAHRCPVRRLFVVRARRLFGRRGARGQSGGVVHPRHGDGGGSSRSDDDRIRDQQAPRLGIDTIPQRAHRGRLRAPPIPSASDGCRRLRLCRTARDGHIMT